MSVLAIDIGGTAIKAGLVDPLSGAITDTCEVPSRGADGGEAVLARVLQLCDRYTGYSAVGVSTAGQVDTARGVITYANENIPGYTGLRLGERLEALLHVPISIGNDAHCAALGEAERGAAVGLASFVMLTIGTGIGGAAVSGGQLVLGATGRAGQLGHIVTHAAGIPCVCGARGCWEQYASTSALVRSARELQPQWNSGRTVIAAVASGDQRARALLDHWIEELAYGVASLIAVFEPDLVVLGGGMMEDRTLLAQLTDSVHDALMEPLRHVSIAPAKLGNRAALLGAAIQAFGKLGNAS
jgi:predicted NBD/HSP70 family sugar kinase